MQSTPVEPAREHLEVRKSLFVQEPSGEGARKQAALVLVSGQLLVRSRYSSRKELSAQEGSSQVGEGLDIAEDGLNLADGPVLCLHGSAGSLLLF